MLEFLESMAIGFMLTVGGIVLLGNFFVPIFLKHNDKINEQLKDEVPPN